MTSPDDLNDLLPERPLTVAEVADWLNYDPKTVRRLIRHRDPKKRLSAKKVGGQWRIPPSAVISLLERDIDP
jgi:excisionase family DNA binding protein